MHRLERRLEALEAQTGPADVARAVQFAGSDEVEILGTGERMPRAAFEQRYPAGLVILWLYEELCETV